MTEESFITRLTAIDQHVSAQYPQIWIDTWLFLIAILLVALAAAISIVARATDLSVWYPLIILLAPAMIAFITTRRRNTYYIRLGRYYESLQTLLKEINSQDVTKQIKWTFRRPKESDMASDMALSLPLTTYNINFVIDVSQIDTVTELAHENLPAYDTSTRDIVLDMGPSPPAYPTLEMTNVQPPPPAYPSTR